MCRSCGADPADKLDAYLGGREASPLGWSPRGELLIATRFGDVDQLHVVDHAGAERRQITFLREPITQAAFSPDPNRSAYVFFKSAGGNENAQLYYQRQGESTPHLLTDGKSSNGGAVWSNGGRRSRVLQYCAGRCDLRYRHRRSGRRRACRGCWSPATPPPGIRSIGRRTTESFWFSNTCRAPRAICTSSTRAPGKSARWTRLPAKVGIAGAKFSRDGQGVYVISDRDSEFAKLALHQSVQRREDRDLGTHSVGHRTSDPLPGWSLSRLCQQRRRCQQAQSCSICARTRT